MYLSDIASEELHPSPCTSMIFIPTSLYPALDFIFHDNNLPTAYASPGSLVIPVSFYFSIATFYLWQNLSIVYIL